MRSLTVGGHTYRRLRIGGSELEAELKHASIGAKKCYVRREGGCVLTDEQLAGVERSLPAESRASDL